MNKFRLMCGERIVESSLLRKIVSVMGERKMSGYSVYASFPGNDSEGTFLKSIHSKSYRTLWGGSRVVQISLGRGVVQRSSNVFGIEEIVGVDQLIEHLGEPTLFCFNGNLWSVNEDLIRVGSYSLCLPFVREMSSSVLEFYE